MDSAGKRVGGELRSLHLDAELRKALEAILLVVDEPVDATTLAQVLEVPTDEVTATLKALRTEYVDEGRGFVLREVGGGWRFYTDPGAAEYVDRFVLHGRSGRLSQASLETLAIVSYKQPITRAQVSDIRGVDADGAIRSLVSRGLVEEVGRAEAPGQPLLYGTSAGFLERMGLTSLDELAPLPTHSPPGPPPPEPAPGGYKAARRELDALGPDASEEGDEGGTLDLSDAGDAAPGDEAAAPQVDGAVSGGDDLPSDGPIGDDADGDPS